jgi:hypothetical protein
MFCKHPNVSLEVTVLQFYILVLVNITGFLDFPLSGILKQNTFF